MPGFAVHCWIANECIARGIEEGISEFQETIGLHKNNVYWGSIGPDLGLYPGGDQLIADLAHYIHTGQLVSKLKSNASTSQEKAFAFGWLTHYVADVLLHPIVNQGVSEYLKEDRDSEIYYEANPCAHLQIELGLDAFYYLENQAFFQSLSLCDFNLGIEYLQTVYRDVYQLNTTRKQWNSTIRAGTRTAKWMPSLLDLISYITQGSSLSFQNYLLLYLPYKLLGLMTSVFANQSKVHGILSPRKPEPWLIERFNDKIDLVITTTLTYWKEFDSIMPDYNLDTGNLSETESETGNEYQLALKTIEALNKQRANQ